VSQFSRLYKSDLAGYSAAATAQMMKAEQPWASWTIESDAKDPCTRHACASDIKGLGNIEAPRVSWLSERVMWWREHGGTDNCDSTKTAAMLTFCFLRLQESQACAVRIRLSGSTFGRVIFHHAVCDCVGVGVSIGIGTARSDRCDAMRWCSMRFRGYKHL